MIDMSKLYNHNDYENALNEFNNSSPCQWNFFKDVQMEVAKNKCPICECLFDESVKRVTKRSFIEIKATIDHYRPIEFYDFLRCDDKNYILMCSECNVEYKKSNFPLYNSIPRATNKEEIENEKPLIVNPIYDNLLELFILIFRKTSSGKNVLELKPKKSSLEDNYLYLKAIETIKVFGLGDCEINRHQNDNIHNCRIKLLGNHFNRFYTLAKARKIGKNEFLGILREHPENYHFGFTKFIAKEQFKINI